MIYFVSAQHWDDHEQQIFHRFMTEDEYVRHDDVAAECTLKVLDQLEEQEIPALIQRLQSLNIKPICGVCKNKSDNGDYICDDCLLKGDEECEKQIAQGERDAAEVEDGIIDDLDHLHCITDYEEDRQEQEAEEREELASNCKCGAWQFSALGTPVHISDCICGAEAY